MIYPHTVKDYWIIYRICKAATVMWRSIQWLDWYPWSTLNGHLMNTWLTPWLTLNQHLIYILVKGQLIFVDKPLSVNQYMSHSTLNWILTCCTPVEWVLIKTSVDCQLSVTCKLGWLSWVKENWILICSAFKNCEIRKYRFMWKKKEQPYFLLKFRLLTEQATSTSTGKEWKRIWIKLPRMLKSKLRR